MGEKRAFVTDKAAVTGGPYSQAIIHNDLVYVSGQGSVDPETNEIKLGTVEEEAEMALENMRIILEEADSFPWSMGNCAIGGTWAPICRRKRATRLQNFAPSMYSPKSKPFWDLLTDWKCSSVLGAM